MSEIGYHLCLFIFPSFRSQADFHRAIAKGFTVLQTCQCLHRSTKNHHILRLSGRFWSHSKLHSPDTQQQKSAQHPHTEDNGSQLKFLH